MNLSKKVKGLLVRGTGLTFLFALSGTLVAATPSSVPAWIDINSQIPARTDIAETTVAFSTSANGRCADEETGGTWTLSTMQPGCMIIFR